MPLADSLGMKCYDASRSPSTTPLHKYSSRPIHILKNRSNQVLIRLRLLSVYRDELYYTRKQARAEIMPDGVFVRNYWSARADDFRSGCLSRNPDSSIIISYRAQPRWCLVVSSGLKICPATMVHPDPLTVIAPAVTLLAGRVAILLHHSHSSPRIHRARVPVHVIGRT
jgi:hypothetical protein